jgi:hypothetical protein
MNFAVSDQIVFAPLVPWPLVGVIAALALVVVGLAFYAGLRGRWARLSAAALLLAALAGPSLRSDERAPLSDIVLLAIDESASQKIGDRPAQTAAAVARIEAEVAALPNTELHKITVADGADDSGTLAMEALAKALADVPRNRVAGAILISDGQVHDAAVALNLPAPLNLLLTGHKTDWDRRLHITKAPTFGIIGEETKIGLRIDEQGAIPAAKSGVEARLTIAIDGGTPQTYGIPVNQDLELPLKLDHAGQNVVQFTLEADHAELTDRNNLAVVQINGVRDRLRVLLISGEPYAGERTWRNLLKSDNSVDLVHFTILRPPDKDDGVPVNELSLIAFPTRELFVEKINEFDLIVFDRYPQRGILPGEYLDNIRDYVLGGGAVLVAAGPDFASAESLYFSGLADVLPARPTTRVIDGGFTPKVSAIGERHPVTEGLEAAARDSAVVKTKDGPPWGRWMRMVEVDHPRGQVVMEGPDKRPLLILNREGKGRVALLASDQAWLWGRGFEGGGPQMELLRHLAHWMMKEPELEEEALIAEAKGGQVVITRRSLKEGAREVTVTAPDGTVSKLALTEVKPGLYRAPLPAPVTGLYHLKEGDLERVFALGPSAPREFENAIATGDLLAEAVAVTRGGVTRLEDGLPDLRRVRADRPAFGRGWIGITPRAAYRTIDLRLTQILPDWVLLLLAAGLMVLAWMLEGRRRQPPRQ